MISVVCAYNDRAVLDRYLFASLATQTAEFELITIDNCAGAHRSAAAILNRSAARASGDLLLFTHQDISFRSATWLADVERRVAARPDLGAAGAAGKNGEGLLFSAVWHGDPPTFVGSAHINAPVPVQVLDGCLIAVPAAVFRQIPFDEDTCPCWYLYVADYCLDLAQAGYKVYVLPDRVTHRSTGPTDVTAFASAARRIAAKHRHHARTIHLTVGDWSAWCP